MKGKGFLAFLFKQFEIRIKVKILLVFIRRKDPKKFNFCIRFFWGGNLKQNNIKEKQI
jgi:hypothetical protein